MVINGEVVVMVCPVACRCLNPKTQHNGGMLGETYATADTNVLTLLNYVQPKPTTFHVREAGSVLCITEGAYANPRCTLRSGLPLNSSFMAAPAKAK